MKDWSQQKNLELIVLDIDFTQFQTGIQLVNWMRSTLLPFQYSQKLVINFFTKCLHVCAETVTKLPFIQCALYNARSRYR